MPTLHVLLAFALVALAVVMVVARARRDDARASLDAGLIAALGALGAILVVLAGRGAQAWVSSPHIELPRLASTTLGAATVLLVYGASLRK